MRKIGGYTEKHGAGDCLPGCRHEWHAQFGQQNNTVCKKSMLKHSMSTLVLDRSIDLSMRCDMKARRSIYWAQ